MRVKQVTKLIERVADIPRVIKFMGCHATDQLSRSDRKLVMTLAHFKIPRTLDQNKLMHLWFSEIAAAVGDDARSVKSDLKGHFLPQIVGLQGVIRTKDTHELDTAEMRDFLQGIEAMASENGWEITQPPMVSLQ